MVDLNTVIRPAFVVIALFANMLGAILKYRTPLPNKLLPLVLFAVCFFACGIWGYNTSLYGGTARWVDAIFMCGLIHGTIVTSIAVWGWDTVYGLYKNGLKRGSSK